MFPCLPPGDLPHRPCELETPVSTCGQVVITGNFHKAAVLLHADSGSICNQNLGKVGFLDGELEWKVPEQTHKGLSLTTSSP